MGVLKTFAVAGLAMAAVANGPLLLDWAGDGAGAAGRAAAGTAVDAGRDALADATAPTASYARMCPLLDAYFAVDATGQKALAAGITALADQGATSDDPAVRAFSQTVPVALSGRGQARDAARALLVRECRAAGQPTG